MTLLVNRSVFGQNWTIDQRVAGFAFELEEDYTAEEVLKGLKIAAQQTDQMPSPACVVKALKSFEDAPPSYAEFLAALKFLESQRGRYGAEIENAKATVREFKASRVPQKRRPEQTLLPREDPLSKHSNTLNEWRKELAAAETKKINSD